MSSISWPESLCQTTPEGVRSIFNFPAPSNKFLFQEWKFQKNSFLPPVEVVRCRAEQIDCDEIGTWRDFYQRKQDKCERQLQSGLFLPLPFTLHCNRKSFRKESNGHATNWLPWLLQRLTIVRLLCVISRMNPHVMRSVQGWFENLQCRTANFWKAFANCQGTRSEAEPVS